ncbi:MAG: sugar phosphate nucleotidyltransferase [Bryobacteraceae bacterium]
MSSGPHTVNGSGAPKAVILAGGQGIRIRHLLPNLPKPMAVAAGKPFLEWVVRYLAKQGLADVTISTGYRSSTVAAHFDRLELPGMQIRCEPERVPLGTAGGFLHAVGDRAAEPVTWLVCNGDSLDLVDLQPMFALAAKGHAQAVVLGLHAADCSRYGSLQADSQGRLLRFSEKTPGRGLINAGVYLFTADLLRQFPPTRPLSFETDVFPTLLAANARIAVSSASAPFLDIGTEETLPYADQFVMTNLGHFL